MTLEDERLADARIAILALTNTVGAQNADIAALTARIHEQEAEIARLTAAGLAAEAKWADEVEKRRKQEEVIQAGRQHAELTLGRVDDLDAMSAEALAKYTPAAAFRMIRLEAERTIAALSVSSATDGDQHA